MDNLKLSWCLFHKPKIDNTRYHENVYPAGGKDRHPDNLQFAVNQGTAGSQGSRNVTIENCWFETWDDYQHNILFLNERWLRVTGGNIRENEFQNVKVTNCRMLVGHTHAIALSGGDYALDRIWISPFPPNNFKHITGESSSTNHEPTISVLSGVTGSIKNCSLTRDIWLSPGSGVNAKNPTLANITRSGNVVLKANEATPPTGWVDIEGKTGPYGGGTATVTKPGALESAYVTMGKIYDCGQVEFADGTFQAWSGTVIVTDDSLAWDADPSKVEFQWRAVDEGVNSWKPCRVGTPSKNEANSTRYELRSDYETAAAATAAGYPGAHRVHCRKTGSITMEDITLRWRPVGTTTWSDESTFSLSFTTPAAGTSPNVSAVTLNSAAYTVGQTATATATYTVGTGTVTSLVFRFLLGTTAVSTQTVAITATSTSASASFVTTAAGSLTCEVTLTTSVLPVSTRTSTAATVSAAATPPAISSVTLDKAAYTVGDIATVAAQYTSGSSTATLTYQWKRAGVNISGATASAYTTVVGDVGSALTCTVTATSTVGAVNMTSAGSAVVAAGLEPSPPTETQWEVAGVVSAPNFANRFTAQLRLLIPDASITAVDWVGEPLPAMDPALLATAAGVSDYRYTTATAEGSNTAYHGMTAETVAYEVWRGNSAYDARLLTQLRRWLSAGGDPTGKGGLAMQYDVHAAICIMAAKLTARIWAALSASEREKLQVILEGIAVGAAYSASATSPTPTQNLVGAQNQPKNTPNWRTSAPTALYCLAVFYGGYGAPDIAGVLAFLAGFSKATFYARCVALGLNNMADTMKARGGSTGLAGPTNAQVEGALDSWQFVARTGSTHWNLSDVMGIWKSEMEFGFIGTIASGLNSGAGVTVGSAKRGLLMAGASGLPNAGLTGQLHQLDTTDGLGQRSSMSYAIRNLFNSIDMCLAFLIGGLYDKSASNFAAVVARIDRGMTDFAYKHANGYLSYAQGGDSMSEDWTPTLAYVVSHNVPVQLGLYTGVIKPFLESAAAWRHTVQRGTDAQGRKLWELLGSNAADQSHTVGYDETSEKIYIRISTANGTSNRTIAGKTFTGPEEPPQLPEELPALSASGWDLEPVAAPGLVGMFTGSITLTDLVFAATVASVEWSGASGVWRTTTKIGDGVYRMDPGAGMADHAVAYGHERTDIRVRYTTAAGTSAASATKTLTAPPEPVSAVDPGEEVDGGAVVGEQMTAAELVRPSTPTGELIVSQDPDDASYVTLVMPPLMADAMALVVSYGGRRWEQAGGSTARFLRIPGNGFGLITAVAADGTPSVARYFIVP